MNSRLLVAAVVAALGLAGCSSDDPDPQPERPGRVWDVAPDDIDTTDVATVRLPVGDLHVRLGTPTRDAPSALPDAARVGADARYLPVAWSLLAGTDTLDAGATRLQPRVTLVVGDDRFDLPPTDPADPADVEAARVALVASGSDDLADVAVEVGYDGLTQTVDAASGDVDAGAAEAYYRDRGVPGEECDVFTREQPPRLDIHDAQVRCDLTDVVVTPYLPERGWVASDGQAWVRVSLRVFVSRSVHVLRTGRVYYTARDELSLRLDGDDALEVGRDDRDRGTRVHTFLADALPAELTLTARYRATDRAGQAGGVPFGGTQVLTLG